jgi:hypothetical protein
MATQPASGFEGILERMYKRSGVDTSPTHLEQTYGFRVCLDPKTAQAAAKKLPVLRRQSDTKATELFSI